jgi:hypothetical protein
MATSLSWRALAQAGCGKFQPMNMPMTKISSVLIKALLLMLKIPHTYQHAVFDFGWCVELH